VQSSPAYPTPSLPLHPYPELDVRSIRGIQGGQSQRGQIIHHRRFSQRDRRERRARRLIYLSIDWVGEQSPLRLLSLPCLRHLLPSAFDVVLRYLPPFLPSSLPTSLSSHRPALYARAVAPLQRVPFPTLDTEGSGRRIRMFDDEFGFTNLQLQSPRIKAPEI